MSSGVITGIRPVTLLKAVLTVVIAIPHSSTTVGAARMKCGRLVGERHAYWNIKGWGHFVVLVRFNCLSFRLFAEGYFEQPAAPLRYHS